MMLDQLERAFIMYAVVLIVVTAGIGYAAGTCSGHRSEKLEANGRRIAVATPHREAAAKHRQESEVRSAKAKAHRDSVKVHVVVESDTVVRIDSILVSVPAPVVSLLRADDRQIKMDSLRIDALELELAATREERDAWKERAELLKPPRLGFKSGLLAGAALVVALVSLAR